MTASHTASARAAELRRAFDQSFAHAPGTMVERENYLGVGIGDDSYVIALNEIGGIFADKTIVPLPSRAATCLGVVGLRGEIIPVHGFGALLGYPPQSASPRWLVLAGELALAFDAFEGYLQLPAADISQAQDSAAKSHIRGTARVAGTSRPILHIHSIIDAITGKAASNGQRGSIEP